MRPSDVDAVLKIEQSVQVYPWTRGNFSDAQAHGNECWVEVRDDAIVGYAILRHVLDEAELLTIGVAAESQRKGVGRGLLNGLIRMSRDSMLRRLFLEVRRSNHAAIALYRAAGFAEVGIRKEYYRNAEGAEDAIVMACTLIRDEHGPA
jgi:ribosomal-protein-alanine N-acetyltransferase